MRLYYKKHDKVHKTDEYLSQYCSLRLIVRIYSFGQCDPSDNVLNVLKRWSFGCCIVSAARDNIPKSVWTPRLATIHSIFTRSINCFVITRTITGKSNGLRFQSIPVSNMLYMYLECLVGAVSQLLAIHFSPLMTSHPPCNVGRSTDPRRPLSGSIKSLYHMTGGAFLWRQNKIGGKAIHAQIDRIRSFNFLKIQ